MKGVLLNPAGARRILWVGCLGGVAAAALVLFCFDPARVAIYPVCAFHHMTGLNCPGCGSLRALHELLHGHLWSALRLNALAVLSVPFLGWLGYRFARHAIQGSPVVVRPVWLWIYLSAWIAFGILRELPVPFMAWFAP